MVIEVLMRTANHQENRPSPLLRLDGKRPLWKVLPGTTAYDATLERMRTHARLVASGKAEEEVWLLEHPPLYTAGTSARPHDLINPDRFPVHAAGRGGQYTYHGPGQRVVYLMLDLSARGKDIRQYVWRLEQWIIDTLAAFSIDAFRSPGRVGVWVRRPGSANNRQDKIAAIGVRVSRWASFHGISLNVCPDLSHYQGIVPCGISDQGVTSFEQLGHIVSMEEVDMALHRAFQTHFGPTRKA